MTATKQTTSKMKGRSLSVLGILAASVGAVFIICFSAISIAGLTIACGALFVAVGAINMLFFGNGPEDAKGHSRVLSFISNAAAIVLGISMLVFQAVFAPLIAFMLGLLIAVCAVWQFFVLAVAARPFQLPSWLYIFPVLLVAGAIYIFILKGAEGDAKLMLATGIALAVLGAGCLIEGSVLGYLRRHFNKEAKAHDAQLRDAAEETPKITQAETPKPRIETTDDLDDEVR